MDVLPSEILCNIFLQSLPCSFRTFDPPFGESIASPLYISHVCRGWRSLALSYGVLWSYLCIDYMSPKDSVKRKLLVEVFDTWVSRTNGAPISYVFYCSLNTNDGAEDHRRAEYMITTLLSHQHRWKDVDFSWFGVHLSHATQELKMDDMRALTSLSLRVDFRRRCTINTVQSFQLKNLDLYGNYDLQTDGETLPSLKAVTRLQFSSARGFYERRAIQTCLNFLRSASFLQEFEVNFFVDGSGLAYTHDPPLILPKMRTLKLDYGDAPAMIIDSVTLPSLDALYYSSNAVVGILLRFFRRSSPPLTCLSLSGGCVDEDEIIEILRLAPTLKNLRCSDVSLSGHFFRALTVNSDFVDSATGQRVVCPTLETLHLCVLLPVEDSDGTVEAWVNMLKSRARVQELLKTIYISIGMGGSAVADATNIGRYAHMLKKCLGNSEGVVIAGDRQRALRMTFPLTRF